MSDDLKALGESADKNKSSYNYDHPTSDLLETFPNPMRQGFDRGNHFTSSIKIVAPEFSSLCPITGAPDFATIVVEYKPDKLCVESKAFKLYLGSFRMHGEFHESCVNRICQDLVDLLDPLWLEVEGQFTPRGGIPFWPKVVYTQG